MVLAKTLWGHWEVLESCRSVRTYLGVTESTLDAEAPWKPENRPCATAVLNALLHAMAVEVMLMLRICGIVIPSNIVRELSLQDKMRAI
jgi:hypothetical protein